MPSQKPANASSATTVTPADLCAVLQDRARATHELIAYSYSAGLGVSEETLTDINLVEIARKLPKGHVITTKFTKHQESWVSGADWLWTIGRPGRWLSLLVQAKLARPAKPSVHGLHHGDGQQRQTLVRYAIQERLLPLYVVYSAFDGTMALPRPSRWEPRPKWTSPCGIARDDVKLMGCVTVRPQHVASMHRGKSPKTNAAQLLSYGHPWSCLFCCCWPSRGELADAALAGVWNLPRSRQEDEDIRRPDPDAPDDQMADDLITGEPPALVRDLLVGREPDEVPPFSAVTVVSSEPLPPAKLRRDQRG